MNNFERKIKTHSLPSMLDQRAIATLKNRLSKNNKFMCYLSKNDKTPNTDGRLEFVPRPGKSRATKHTLSVQVKGTQTLKKLKMANGHLH